MYRTRSVFVTYSSWIKFFKLHAKAYKVLNHIDGTPAPEEGDPDYDQWTEIDALVLQWIYNTLSDDLLVYVIENDTTARSTWVKLQNIFLNNKGSRAAVLKDQFTDLTLTACSSMDEYCQKLKDIATQLSDVDKPVEKSRLVLQLVRGLPTEYDTVAVIINQNSSSWDVARDMLELEQRRQSARTASPSHSAMVTTTGPDRNQHQYAPHPDRGRGRSTQWRGGRGRGRGRNSGPGFGGQRGWKTHNGSWNPDWHGQGSNGRHSHQNGGRSHSS